MYRYHADYCSCSYAHHYNFEAWSRQRTIATWVVTGVCLVALAIGLPFLRNANERSWCSGNPDSPVSQPCLAEQKAIRCGPFGVLHCPPGGD